MIDDGASQMWQSAAVEIWKSVTGAGADPVAGGAAVTIGVFDGVHRGHQALMRQVAELAAAENLRSVAVTFDPHPMAVLVPERAPAMLTSIERRVELLHAHGMDEVRVLAFSPEISRWSPQEFVSNVVVQQCGTRRLAVGENFRFGAKAAGDVALLAQLAPEYGYTLSPHVLVGDGEQFSSSRARRAVASGDVAGASEVLGRFHEVSGPVVTGDRRGRTLGFPTANVDLPADRAVPADGVYASWLRVDGERLPAATSVGTNPTFEGVVGRRVEAYVLDRTDLELYGKDVHLEFVTRVRGMEVFDDVTELVERMQLDVAEVRRELLG